MDDTPITSREDWLQRAIAILEKPSGMPEYDALFQEAGRRARQELERRQAALLPSEDD